MATVETLYHISEQLNIYWGLFMFIFGIIGNVWNLLIFRHYSLRLNSCCTYMLIGSIGSIIHLLFGLSDRIASKGFQLHWTANSIIWCKARYYISQCASLIALSCLILSILDRFFSTCREIKWRHLNSVSTARRICLFVTLFWILVTIPIPIYVKPMDISSTKRLCINSSVIWSKVIIYFLNLCCYGIFPWFFTSLFGYLTLRNIRQIHQRRIGPISSYVLSRMAQIDHQLTSILFLQIILYIIFSIPYCIQNLYRTLTQTSIKSEYRQAQEYLFLQVTLLIFYLNYISTFYINYISSTIFRQTAKQVIMNLFKKQENTSRQITMINHQENNSQLENPRLKIFTIKPSAQISPV